jgi:TetR/AcrR family transcriptional repressor of nem operon
VVADAERIFWTRGYKGTSIDELEASTGLSRSSLYLAFGTKAGLFDASLTEYVATVTDPLFASLEAPGAGLHEAAGFFITLAARFRKRGARRGCLMINTIAERAGRDPGFSAQASDFLERVQAAFSNALHNTIGTSANNRAQAADRARMLTACTLGVWLAVRADHDAAIATCEAIAAQIMSWEPTKPPSRGFAEVTASSRARP